MARLAIVGLLAMLCATAFARHHGPRNSPRGGEPGQFDYYLLTLSWSPSYCLVHPQDRSQCGGRGYGFVLHGLWPQFDSGGYPQACAPGGYLDPAAQARGRTIYPSPKLMQHEWDQHGTCTGLAPLEYFRTADRAMGVVHIPAVFEAPRHDVQLPPQQILGAFQAANPALPAGALVVACSRAELSDVRVCLTRDLQPRPCGRGVRNSCPSVPISIPSAR